MPETTEQSGVAPAPMHARLRAIAAKANDDPRSLTTDELDELCRIAFALRDQKADGTVG